MESFKLLADFCQKQKYTLYVIAHFKSDIIFVEVRRGKIVVKEDGPDIESASKVLVGLLGLAPNVEREKLQEPNEEDDDCF